MVVTTTVADRIDSPPTKTIYFPDYPKSASGRSGVTVPFRAQDAELFDRIKHLSSHSLREIIGFSSYREIEGAARDLDCPLATYVRDLIAAALPSKNGSKKLEGHALALQATFRGGRGSPLHDWYPYLEGYSPEFVRSLIATFAPRARNILDPFCGLGTTALVAALEGRVGLYTEINPVCRYIIEAKATAISLPAQRRYSLSQKLEQLAETLTRLLKLALPDTGLKASYKNAFGRSEFFESTSFHIVLKLRSLADELLREDVDCGRLFVVAILRSLVPGSLLIRRGDLRFRTPSELSRNPPNLTDELRLALRLIASDLLDAPTAAGSTKLVCNDARDLSPAVVRDLDAIITSPPYLNGTNYFRNTKIELWFLRCLKSKEELRSLRDAAITCGINDVTSKKAARTSLAEAPSALEYALKRLNENAYDQRIPLMVQSYFQEMAVVIERLKIICKKGTPVILDLGNSCYGNVIVPTDAILSELLSTHGFVLRERIILRERQSRGGEKLAQTLQIFERTELTNRKRKAPPRNISASIDLRAWEQFKTTLPHQSGDMARRNWGHPWHSICSYQGKLKPAIAHSLVRSLLPAQGCRLLDPFAGVGTIPFEARLAEHTAFGFDISPAAIAITRAKLEPFERPDVYAVIGRLATWIKTARHSEIDTDKLDLIRFNGPLSSYFHASTLAEIVAARDFFKRYPPITSASALVFSSLLHILHGNRPYALSRRSHPITPFAPTGPSTYRNLLERLIDKVDRSIHCIPPKASSKSRAFFQDATEEWPEAVANLDAIITSPPFYDSTRFHTANWMRLWFAGWEPDDFKRQPSRFVDERQKQSFEVYQAVFSQASDRLRKGGIVLFHLGKSAKCDMASALIDVAKGHLTLVDTFVENVEHCESHGIRDKGTVTHHQYLLFRKV